MRKHSPNLYRRGGNAIAASVAACCILLQEGCTRKHKQSLTLDVGLSAAVSLCRCRVSACLVMPPPPFLLCELTGHTHFLAHIRFSSDTQQRCNLRSKNPLPVHAGNSSTHDVDWTVGWGEERGFHLHFPIMFTLFFSLRPTAVFNLMSLQLQTCARGTYNNHLTKSK